MEKKINFKDILSIPKKSKILMLTILIIFALVGLFFSTYYIPKLEIQLKERDDMIVKLSNKNDTLSNNYRALLNESTMIPCKVGYNSKLKDNQVSVFVDNKFGLKVGDRIVITYEYGVNKISTECIVNMVEKSERPNSDADFFLSKDCLKFLTSKKRIKYEGVFLMHFRKVTIQYN